MFTTLMDSHNALSGRVDTINERLTDIIRIEEKQLASNQAMSRIGRQVDSQQAEINQLRVDFVALQTGDITDLKVSSGKMWVKVTGIGAVGGSAAAGIITVIAKALGLL